MPEEKVKGALLISLARVIRSRNDLDWLGKTDLTEEDLKLINKGILASIWYNCELMNRMGIAVWKLVGNSTPEGAFIFGYGAVAEDLMKIYASKFTKGVPEKILARFASMYHGTFYTQAQSEFQPFGKGGVDKIFHPEGIPVQPCYIPLLKGFFTKVIEANGGKNVRIKCEEENLVDKQKLDSLTFEISWE